MSNAVLSLYRLLVLLYSIVALIPNSAGTMVWLFYFVVLCNKKSERAVGAGLVGTP